MKKMKIYSKLLSGIGFKSATVLYEGLMKMLLFCFFFVITYADDIVLIARTERNIQDLLQKLVKKNEKIRLNINCKKKECKWLSAGETV